jgi:sodium transport system permease protein
MHPVWLIFVKEVASALRDRRILISTVIIPLLVLPIVTTLPMALIGSKERKAKERPSTLVLTGFRFAELEQALRRNRNFAVVPVSRTHDPTAHHREHRESGKDTENPLWSSDSLCDFCGYPPSQDSVARDIRQNLLDVALEVTSLPAGRNPAEVRILFNATRTESRAAADKAKLVIAEVARELLARHVDTTRVSLNPVQAVPTNVASEREMTGFIMGMLVGMMAVIGLISGGMVMAIDCTAGEKERRTLEVLLAAPVPRAAIVLGKFLATLVMGMVSVLLMTCGYALSLLIGLRQLAHGSQLPFGSLAIPWTVVPVILAVMLGVAAFVAALEMAVSIFARSYREAQTYLTPLTILAVVPVMFVQTLPAVTPPGLFYIPFLNAMLLIRELLMGAVNAQHILNTLGSSLLCAALALRLALSMFKRESVLLR